MDKLFTVAEHSEVVTTEKKGPAKPDGLSNIRIIVDEKDAATPELVIRVPFWRKCICFKKILSSYT